MSPVFKKIICLFFAVFMLSVWSYAQSQNSNRLQNEQFALQLRTAEARMGQRIEMLTKRLALTPEQLDKIKKIERHNLEEERRVRERASLGNDMKGMPKNTGGGPGFNPSMEQRSLNYDFIRLRKEADDEIAKLLEGKQIKKFAVIREKDEQMRRERELGVKPHNQEVRNQNINRKGKVQSNKNLNPKF